MTKEIQDWVNIVYFSVRFFYTPKLIFTRNRESYAFVCHDANQNTAQCGEKIFKRVAIIDVRRH